MLMSACDGQWFRSQGEGWSRIMLNVRSCKVYARAGSSHVPHD